MLDFPNLMINRPKYIFADYAFAKIGALGVPLGVLAHSSWKTR